MVRIRFPPADSYNLLLLRGRRTRPIENFFFGAIVIEFTLQVAGLPLPFSCSCRKI
jgi:hypothetical protein